MSSDYDPVDERETQAKAQAQPAGSPAQPAKPQSKSVSNALANYIDKQGGITGTAKRLFD